MTAASETWTYDRALLGIGAAGLLVGAISCVSLQLEPPSSTTLLAAGAYISSHVLRYVRTLVVVGDSMRSVRAVAVAHLGSAAWGLLPLKIGELARMYAIGRASSGPGTGLRVVWIERTFDAIALALASAIALAVVPGVGPAVIPVFALSMALLVVTALMITALPENLAAAKLWVMRRYTTDWSIQLLRLLDEVADALNALRTLVVGRVATLVVLTLAIWSFEVAGLWVLGLRLAAVSSSAFVDTLAVLSDMLMADAGALEGVTSSWRTIVVLTLTAMAPLALAVQLLGGRAAQDGRR